jgi:hypothetical protein
LIFSPATDWLTAASILFSKLRFKSFKKEKKKSYLPYLFPEINCTTWLFPDYTWKQPLLFWSKPCKFICFELILRWPLLYIWLQYQIQILKKLLLPLIVLLLWSCFNLIISGLKTLASFRLMNSFSFLDLVLILLFDWNFVLFELAIGGWFEAFEFEVIPFFFLFFFFLNFSFLLECWDLKC